MYLSVVLNPSEPQGLALLGAIALIRLLQGWGVASRLRWPNDVMVEGRKIGGVLPVARYQGNALERAVLGVGLNVCQQEQDFPPELRDHVTVLARHVSTTLPPVPEVALLYLEQLDLELAHLESAGLAQLCRSCEPWLEGVGESGRQALLVSPGQPPTVLGEVVGLAGDGALLLSSGRRVDALGRDERLRFSDEIAAR
jgi:BirA family biotin operon repressor/biotin-[acetyl-CoA-carboxylase] ligase